MWRKGNCWWECKLVQPLWERVPQKIKIRAVPLLGIYPKKMKTLICKDICSPIIVAALLTIAKIWKQPRSPSMDDWIKKMWYIYTMEYYSSIKK